MLANLPIWILQLSIWISLVKYLCCQSKISVNGDSSLEIKRRLLLGKKAMTNPDSILKSKDIPLPTKVHIVKSMVFPVVMYGCESWTIKKAEHRRTNAFELWCWRRLLSVPWTTRRSNQSILQEINPEHSLEELLLKLQYFGHLMWWANSLEKILMLGKMEGKSRSGQQRMRWLDSITNSVDMNLNEYQETIEDREVWHDTVHCCSVTKSCPTLCNPVDSEWGPQRLGHDLATGQHQQCIPLSSYINISETCSALDRSEFC